MGGVSVIFVGIAWGALQLYGRLIWRWRPWSECRRGWWIYGLIAHRDNVQVEVAGVFYLLHTINGAKIKEGQAFYVKDGNLVPRGNWRADIVWITKDQIKVVFNMHAVKAIPEALPSMYEGYISLSLTMCERLVGKESWEGYFHDLGDRHSVTGGVYSERLSPFSIHTRDEAQQILQDHFAQLVRQAKRITV